MTKQMHPSSLEFVLSFFQRDLLHRLLSLILENCNNCDTLPSAIISYVEKCTFHLKLGAMLSTEFVLEDGMLRGDVLSMILFLVQMNSVSRSLPSRVQYTFYMLMICRFLFPLVICQSVNETSSGNESLP